MVSLSLLLALSSTPESTTEASLMISNERIKACCTIVPTTFGSCKFSCYPSSFFLHNRQSFFTCHFFSQFENSKFAFDLDRLLLDLSWFPWFFHLSRCLTLFLILKVLLDISLVLLLCISWLTPTTSSNTNVFALEIELLTTMTKLSQLSGNEH